MACSRFCSWLFSFWQLTTMPVGRWVMRTAESVVLTRLAAGARRAEHVDPDVLLLDGDVDLLGLGHHQHAGGGRVHAALALGDRDPLDPVHAALELQQRVRRLARLGGALGLHGDGDGLEAAEVGLGGVELLGLPAAPLGVAGVHPQQVAGEQRRLLAALAGLDLQQRVLGVGRVAGHQEVPQPLLGVLAPRRRARRPPRRRTRPRRRARARPRCRRRAGASRRRSARSPTARRSAG